MKHHHKLTYVDLQPKTIKPPRSEWLPEFCAALTFAGFIALPFVLYFAFVMKP